MAILYGRGHQGKSGKLKWAGRAWATGVFAGKAPTEDAIDDARLWGFDLDESDITPADDGGVWCDNQQAVEAFLAVTTQWRMTGTPDGRLVATGLDYAGARAGLALAGIEVTPETWAEIRLIESGAMEAMNEVGS